MTDPKTLHSLVQRTGAAAASYRELDLELSRLEPGPPALGELWVSPSSSDFGVAWAILREGEGQAERLLVAPADLSPLAGPGDLKLSACGTGVTTLRCAHSCWINPAALTGGRRIGVLGDEAIGRALEKRSLLSEGRGAGTELEREVEEGPDYRDWLEEVVAPARRALLGSSEDAPQGQEESDLRQPFEGSPGAKPRPFGFASLGVANGSQRRRALMRVAAVVLLVAMSALAGIVWHQQREIQRLVADRETSVRDHGAQLRRLARRRTEALMSHSEALASAEATYLRELEQARRDREEAENRLRHEIAALDQSRQTALNERFVTSPVIVEFLSPTRSESGVRCADRAASHFILAFFDPEASGATGYRVEVLNRATDRPVGLFRDLQPWEPGVVTVGLPSTLLPPGEYDVRLSRTRAGEVEVVRSDTLTIESEEACAEAGVP